MLSSVFQLKNRFFKDIFKKVPDHDLSHTQLYGSNIIIVVLVEEGDECIDYCGISFTRCNLPCKSLRWTKFSKSKNLHN